MAQASNFEELQFEPHRTGNGVAARAFFPNGYGVSVVQFTIGGRSGSYGSSEGLYELAVIKGDASNWGITYDTPITNDVEGYLTPDAVTALMQRVAQLEAVSA